MGCHVYKGGSSHMLRMVLKRGLYQEFEGNIMWYVGEDPMHVQKYYLEYGDFSLTFDLNDTTPISLEKG